MKNILITGSTQGIGYGLADSFLELGCAVIISGRTRERVNESVTALAAKHPAERIFGHPCDVTQFEQVQALWDAAHNHCGRVDIWINNAGISQPVRDFWSLDEELIKKAVETNLTGAMNGAKVALNGMLAQGHGAIYNMEGMGSNGRKQAGMTLYGCTKYGLAYLTDSLALEAKDTPVLVGAIQPGMVVTDLLTRNREEQPDRWEENKRIFNILADRVETVTPWLAERILANKKHGERISWLNQGKIMFRFLSAPFIKRNVIH